MMQLTVPAARIEWLPDGAPRSLDFDDIYFSRDGGLAESTYVYLQGNQLPDRWPAHFQQYTSFNLFEAGFGTGLNFLLSLRAFAAALPDLPADARLHYVAVEMQPLTPTDLARALACFPELTAFGEELLTQYPPHFRGWHRLSFAEQRVTLTLIFDTADAALAGLLGNAPTLAFDAWYLDGFAPAKNDSLWSETVLTAVASLSRAGTTASSFTAAGYVRRSLQAKGFSVLRTPGFGRKREMLCARKEHSGETRTTRPRPPERIRIIGAGITGLVTAQAFAARGCQVDIYEQSSQIGGALAGHPAALSSPKLTREHSPHSALQLAGFFLLERFLAKTRQEEKHPAGAFELSNNEEARRYNAAGWPAEVLSVCAPEMLAYFGDKTVEKIWLARRHARLINVPALLAQLATHRNVRVHLDQQCPARDNTAQRAPGTLTIYCLGAHAAEHFPELPIQAVRGQASLLPETTVSDSLQTPLRFGGYLLPAQNGVHVLGSTYDRNDSETQLRSESQQRNLQKLAEVWPAAAKAWETAPLSGLVGWRLSTRDRLPVCGFLSAHHALHFGHGSHALSSAWVGAEMLAAHCFGEPPVIDPVLAAQLSPTRFLRGEKKPALR